MSQDQSDPTTAEAEALARDQQFDKVAHAVYELVIAAGLSPNEIIELYMRGMWGMALFVEPDPLIARAKLTQYFTQFSQQLTEELESEAFKASLLQPN